MTPPLPATAVLAIQPTSIAGILRWELVAAASILIAAIATTIGWLIARRRLAECLLEREDLANSSLVIEEERRMLELVARGAPLHDVLNTLTLAIERISPGALCTVMLLDEDGRSLSVASGPSLPREYLQALSGIEIGPEVGACGSAAFRNETVVVEDVATDPKFAAARDLLLLHELRSCWSQPVRDSGNRVLGTFAIYHRHVARPRPQELRMARAAAQLTGNAIERIRAGKALKEAAKRLNLAEKVARFGIWEINFASQIMTISEGMAEMMDSAGDKRQFTREEFEAMIHPEDLARLQVVDAAANGHGDSTPDEFRLLLPSGSVRWMRRHWLINSTEGKAVRATGAMIDITDEKKMLAQSQDARIAAEAAAHAARQAEKLELDRKTILELVAKDRPLDQIATIMAGAVADHLPESFCAIRIELTETPHISVYSRLADRIALTNYAALSSVLDLIPVASFHQTLCCEPIRNLSTCRHWIQFIENCGGLPFRHYRAAPILRNARLTGVIISLFGADRPACQAEEQLLESWSQVASLAVERRGLYEQLSFRAQYDSLTALLNRASLYDRVDGQIRLSGTKRAAMAVLYLDLDLFKEINDNYGHAAGDKVLQEVSRHILGSVRHTDFAARIGGDEFVIILPGVSERREAARVAELVARAIQEPVSFNGRELRVGASFGISLYPDDGLDTDALLKMADEDMYRAKLRRSSSRSLQHPRTGEDHLAKPSRALIKV